MTLFYNTLLWQGAYLHQTMIGSALGNLDAGLGAPYLVVMGIDRAVCPAGVKKPGETQLMTTGNRIWTVIVCAGCAGLTMLSMLIAWTAHVIKRHQRCAGQVFPAVSSGAAAVM